MEKKFCLRGGKEHRELKLSQFQRENNHWKYTEYASMGLRISVEVSLTCILSPSFTFSGCSVNVFMGPVMTSGTFQSSSTSFGLSQADIDNFSKF